MRAESNGLCNYFRLKGRPQLESECLYHSGTIYRKARCHRLESISLNDGVSDALISQHVFALLSRENLPAISPKERGLQAVQKLASRLDIHFMIQKNCWKPHERRDKQEAYP